MKTPNKTQPMLLFSLSLLALLALVAVPFAVAQEGAMDEAPMQEDMQAKMEQHHQMMMERHQKMVDEMQAEMANLDALVAEMKAADGHGAQIDAIAAVVEELVAQHKKHMGQRLEMMEAMGGGMGGHHGMKGHHPKGGHHDMKGDHGDQPCPHCKAGSHKEGMSCDHCKAGGECPHKADGKCPHCAEGGECKHHGGDCRHHGGECPKGEDCPMKDKSMETEEGAMASEGR